MSFGKNHILYIITPYYGKLPIICYLLLVLRNYCTLANDLNASTKNELSLNFCERFRFFLAVFMEKFQNNPLLYEKEK